MGIINRMKGRRVLFDILRFNGASHIEAAWNVFRGMTFGKCMYYPKKVLDTMRAQRIAEGPIYADRVGGRLTFRDWDKWTKEDQDKWRDDPRAPKAS